MNQKWTFSGTAFLSGISLLMAVGCAPIQTVVIKIDRKSQPSAPFLMPLRNLKFLSPFGIRGDSFHTGVDIRGKKGGGDPVMASRSGRVEYTGKKSGYGNMVILLHPDGFRSRYAHLKNIWVKKNTPVSAGDILGLVGRTGRASAAHLHFEILSPPGYFMDPALLLNLSQNP